MAPLDTVGMTTAGHIPIWHGIHFVQGHANGEKKPSAWHHPHTTSCRWIRLAACGAHRIRKIRMHQIRKTGAGRCHV